MTPKTQHAQKPSNSQPKQSKTAILNMVPQQDLENEVFDVDVQSQIAIVEG